jgi:hypothetical protein
MHASKESAPLQHAARRDAVRQTARRVVVPAFAASAVLHLAAFLLIRFHVDPDPYHGALPAPRLINIEPVMQAYEIAPVSAEALPVEVQVEEQRRAMERAPVVRPWSPPAATGEPAPAASPRDLNARERLQYRMGSAEIWRPQAPLPAESLSPDEIVRRRVASQLGEFNDSVAGDAAARARATDWSVKDESGGRWGVSPGKVHLGDVTLPLPFALSVPAGRRDEIAGRVRSWTEIQDQSARAEGREVFNDRVRAIRERAEEERARRNAAQGNGSAGSEPPPPPPDG